MTLAISYGESVEAAPYASLRDAIIGATQRIPDGHFIHASENGPYRTSTYRETLALATDLAVGLQERGMRAGDGLIINLRNSGDFIPALWASALAGFVAVPLVHDIERRFGEKRSEGVLAFVRGALKRATKDHGLNLLITEAAFFEADETQPRPYAFIPELYEERARLRRDEPGNVAEQNIKLSLNSLSGKAAQSVGGNETDPPRTACPWYAAATTAGTRRRVMEAALQNPDAIVQFSTDGVVSLAPLDLDIGEGLGQWEAKRVAAGTPSVFLQSGLYTYRTEDDQLPTIKTRGMKRNYQTQEEWMLRLVPASWRRPSDPNDASTWPKLEIEQTEFITAGSAVAGRVRFKVIGRWAKRPRTIDVHIPGLKRRLNALRPELYYGTDQCLARRCFELVETLPAQNPTPNGYFTPSKPARPKWLETGEIAFTNEFAAEENMETGQIIEAM